MLTPYFRHLGLIKNLPECFGGAEGVRASELVLFTWRVSGDRTFPHSQEIGSAFLWEMNELFFTV